MKFTVDVKLAIDLVASVGKSPRRIIDLAVKLGTTESFLQQIVRKLRMANIIQVSRGPGGGIYSRDVSKPVSLYEILLAMGKKIAIEEPNTDLNSDWIEYEFTGYASSTFVHFEQDAA